MAPAVAAPPATRGIAFLPAGVLGAGIGDSRRFANPRQLMAWLGLVPSEHSSGPKVGRGGVRSSRPPGRASAKRRIPHP